MRRKYLLMAEIIAMIATMFLLMRIQAAPVTSGSQTPTPTPHLEGFQTTLFHQSRGTFLPTVPTIAPEKYTDLSPELSFDQKVAVHIRHANGTRARYDMAWGMLYGFIKKLPKGDALVAISPIVMGSGGYAMPTFAEISPTPTPTYGLTPNATIVLPEMPTAVQPKITDLAPNIPYEDKPSVVVEHPDGSREMFLLAPDQVDAFVESLPKGDELKLVIPPPSASLTREAP